MSFFGFDPSLPRDRSQPSKPPGFAQAPDTFAGLSARSAAATDDDDDGIDFEDTYDGLGDKLDETDDALNEDTFGGDDGESVAVGKDFDFHGATSRVVNVIEEEHAIYARSANRKQPVKPTSPIQLPREVRQVPSLQPDASIWGSTPPPPQNNHSPAPVQQQQFLPQLPQQPYQMHAPTGKKAMTLEEVEAEMFAMNKNKQPIPVIQQMQPSQNQNVPPQLQNPTRHHTPPPITQFQKAPAAPHTPAELQQFPSPPPPPPQQGLPHIQHMLQRTTGSQPVLPQFQEPALRVTPPAQAQPAIQREPVSAQGRNQYGMTTHAPTHQIQDMSETERMAYLEEESRRLKRNHKIAQLARYNGLMTPSDKNFITRIQLQQLVSINNADDNANEDFYYMVHSAIRARANPTQPLNQFAQTYLVRQGNRGGNRRQDNHLQRMEQQVARAVAAAKLRPKASQLVLEGSLGKISFSNVKTPRPMLNIKKSEGPGEQARKPLRTLSGADRKSMLKVIENVYDALLDLEIHERDRAKLPILAPGQPPQQPHFDWQAKRDEQALKLWTAMRIMEPIDPQSTVTHPFIAILSYSKMKRAIPRIFRHLDAEQRITILTMIVVHLDVLDVVKHGAYLPDETQLPSAHREEIDMFASSVLPPLLGYVYEAPLSIVVGLLNLFLERVDVCAVSKTKIGLAFLTMFTSRAEIIKQSGQAGEQELIDWEVVYNRLFDSLQGHWMECFPPSGKFVDDVYVWQFLASVAVGASMAQQQALVGAVKDRVMENVMASKTLPPELGSQKSANVNLFMRAMGLDVELLG